MTQSLNLVLGDTIRKKHNKTTGLIGEQKIYGNEIKVAYSDEEFMILSLDFQSYYVSLVVALWKKRDPKAPIGQLLQRLNSVRLELKKNKDPLDKLYKVATLACTNLNNAYSNVYDPIMYYSMTANGQLMLLELLGKLENFLESIIDCNTDGLIIVIKRVNYFTVMGICDTFEQETNFVIDIRDELDYGIFFGSNKKIYKPKNQEKPVVRGFSKSFGFAFSQKLLIGWLKRGVFTFDNQDDFYHSFWALFQREHVHYTAHDLIDLNKNRTPLFSIFLKMGVVSRFGKKFRNCKSVTVSST